jgi:hypothetical protein
MRLALSTASEPAQASGWLEGFLQASGLLLLHDEALWQVLDDWATGLPAEAFKAVLPLLRRTFATFTPAERRQIGEHVKHGTRILAVAADGDLDPARADLALPLVALMLGLQMPEDEG